MTFSGKLSPYCARSSSIHCVERRARRLVQARDLLGGQLRAHRERREPRAVQDLVRIGVADAAEQARVGQRALERVVLARERRRELLRDRIEHLEAAGIVRGEPGLARDDVQRGALLRAGLGQHQRAARRNRRRRARSGRRASPPARASAAGRRSSGAARARGRRRPPRVEAERDALADPASSRTRRPAADADRRHRGAQQRAGSRAARPASVWPEDAPLERLDVERDVGQFRHDAFATSAARLGCCSLSRAGEGCQS